jgi:hypothetical protein
MQEILTAVLITMIPYVFVLTCPLIPAILIFKTFPETQVSLSGPFSKFTMNATGAFAAYVVVFFIALPVMKEFKGIVDSTQKPTWTISGTYELKDKDQHNIESSNNPTEYYKAQSMLASYLEPPSLIKHGDGKFSLQVCGAQDTLPRVWLVVHGYEGGIVPTHSPDAIEIDAAKHRIRLKNPVALLQSN